MPISIDPDARFDLVLENEMGKPEAERPVFIFKYPTVREYKRMVALVDDSDKASGFEEKLDLLCDAVLVILVGWRNMRDANGEDIEFSEHNLDMVASLADLQELSVRAPEEAMISEMDAKKSARQSRSNTDNYAKDASPESATTAPQNKSQKS